MTSSKHPTHAVHHVSNWDGERDALTSLCVLDEATGEFRYFDDGKPVLEYVGDEIIHAWALTKQTADTERNARRYLALRGEGVLIESVVFDYSGEIISGDDLDAAADRLLDGGE